MISNLKFNHLLLAVNAEGQSEPLETDESTVAKNPYDRPDRPGSLIPTDWDVDHVDLKWDPPSVSDLTDYYILLL